MNAVGFFKPTGGQKPEYISNQFGATYGGPIKRNRAFLFADYEGWRRLQRALSFGSVPTLAQRQGNFGIPVKNPYTGEMYNNGIIPPTALTQFGLTVLSQLPLPNLAGNTSNYSALLPATDNDNKGDIRYDHYFTDKITFFTRYSYASTISSPRRTTRSPDPAGKAPGSSRA